MAAVCTLEDLSKENDRVSLDNHQVRACCEGRTSRVASRKTLIFCSNRADLTQNQTWEFQRKVKVQNSKVSYALPCGSTAFLVITVVLTWAMKRKASVAECRLCMVPETLTLIPRLT